MAVNKVIYGSQTLIDISDTTATADKIISGYTAYGADGVKITGTANVVGSGTIYQDENGFIVISEESGDEILLQNKLVSPTESAQNITADSGYGGLHLVQVGAISSTYIGSDITVDPSLSITDNVVTVPEGYYSDDTTGTVAAVQQATPSISVNTSNGLITASVTQTSGYVFGTTTSDTEQLTTKSGETITPTESEQVAVNVNVYTLGQVKVGAISSTYVGSGIATDPTPTVSANVVTIPTGYYSSNTDATVPGVTKATPSISVDSNGLITATVTQSAGYVTAGSTSNTEQLTTQAAVTITPTETSQVAVSSGKYTTGNVTVAAISSTYVGSGITVDPTPTVSDARIWM